MPSLPHASVLVIDDSEAVRTAFDVLLSIHGARVLTAASPADGLARLGRDEVDEKALAGLTGVLRTTRKVFAGRTYVDLAGFASASEWEFISKDAREGVVAGGSDDVQLHAD